MTRIVIDTNVFVSSVLGGRLAVITDLWRNGQFTLIVSHEIVREYIEVLRRPKLRLLSSHIDAVAAFVLQRAEFVTPTTQVTIVTADPDDNKFLEAAVAGQAEYLVSGDHHLLDFGAHQGIRIVTAREFIDLLQALLSSDLPATE
jgi:uncharacterized protein